MKADYGIDAPGLVRIFFIVGAANLALIAILFGFFAHFGLAVAAISVVLIAIASYTLFMGLFHDLGQQGRQGARARGCTEISSRGQAMSRCSMLAVGAA